MKTIKILLLAVAFTFSGVLTASTEPTKAEPTTTITSEIGERLKNPDFLVDKDITANVKIVVNKDNELVVLSVDSDDVALENFIKARLNYTKLSVKMKTGQKSFIVPVRITQKK